MDSTVLNESKCVNFNIFKKSVWRKNTSFYTKTTNFLAHSVVWGFLSCLHGLPMMSWNSQATKINKIGVILKKKNSNIFKWCMSMQLDQVTQCMK